MATLLVPLTSAPHWAVPLPRRDAELQLMRLAVNAFVALDFLYVCSFNLLEETLRLQLAAGLFAAQGALALVATVLRFAPWRFALLAMTAALAMTWLLRLSLEGRPVALGAAGRDLFPFLFAIWILAYRQLLSMRLLALGCAAAIGTALAFAMFVTPIERAELVRIAPFTGSPDGLNSSALFVALTMLLADQLRRRGALGLPGFAALAGVGFVLLLGYRLSAALMLVALYALTALLLDRRIRPAYRLAVLVAGVLLVVGIVVEHETRHRPSEPDFAADSGALGSGRIGVWRERIADLSERRGADLLLGTGPDSDHALSRRWMTDAIVSHGDALSILAELGLVGLFAVAVFVGVVAAALGPQVLPLFAAVVPASMITVGLYHVPSITLFFWLAVALAAAPPRTSGRRPRTVHANAVAPYDDEAWPPAAARHDWLDAPEEADPDPHRRESTTDGPLADRDPRDRD